MDLLGRVPLHSPMCKISKVRFTMNYGKGKAFSPLTGVRRRLFSCAKNYKRNTKRKSKEKKGLCKTGFEIAPLELQIRLTPSSRDFLKTSLLDQSPHNRLIGVQATQVTLKVIHATSLIGFKHNLYFDLLSDLD